MNISFQKLFYVTASLISFFAILILARSILIPLAFALLISFMLYPLVKKMELWGMNKILAAFFSIFAIIILIGGGIFLFSTQIIELSTEFTNFRHKIILVFADVTVYINKNVSFVPDLEKNELSGRIKAWLSESTGTLVKQTFSSSATFLAGLLATIVFTFLFIIYRTGIIKALLAFAPEGNRDRVLKMFKSVQQVGQKYLGGLFILVIILGLANSIGLWIIGIDNPFFFGFLGAFLAIIPYVGTITGALLPMLYAFISNDAIWMVIAVAILFWLVQMITDNYLTPKILGGSMNINALTAILSLIVGGVVWGIAGMILFLPYAAMFKIVCEEYDELKPVALLIGNQNYQEDDGSKGFISKGIDKIKSWVKKAQSTSKQSENSDS